jgi:hypothetical protein
VSEPGGWLVTTVAGKSAERTVTWDGLAPLPIGQPFRWVLERSGSELRLRELRAGADGVCRRTEIGVGRTWVGDASRSPEEMIEVRVRRARLGRAGLEGRVAKRVAAPIAFNEHPELGFFKRALIGTAAALALIVVLSWVWPKPAEQELVPAQFAKLVLTAPKPRAPEKQPHAAQGSTAPHEEAAKAKAVVQAFRAKALRSAVSGLLKGGMTKLLEESKFVTGADPSAEAKRLFDHASDALKPTGPEAGSGTRQVAVAQLGGGASGASVGYGKGEHAQVKGQGRSFVATDLAGTDVGEGLTKDEVGEVIHRHMSEVRYCYESAMLRTPELEGKMVAGFVIGKDGIVKSTEVRSSTLPDPRLDDCILRRLVTWKFPLPKGGIDVEVTYPFIFKTLGR